MAQLAKWSAVAEGTAAAPKQIAPPDPSTLAPVITLIPPPAAQRGRRAISPVSGHALEKLGHAIEYLADEYAFHSGEIPSIHVHDPQIEAMRMLMTANREVYYACPLLPPLYVRLKRRFFGAQGAGKGKEQAFKAID